MYIVVRPPVFQGVDVVCDAVPTEQFVEIVRFLRSVGQNIELLDDTLLHLIGRLVGKRYRQDAPEKSLTFAGQQAFLQLGGREKQLDIFEGELVGFSGTGRGSIDIQHKSLYDAGMCVPLFGENLFYFLS